MKLSRLLLSALFGAAIAVSAPGAATAATTYTDTVAGFEYYATSTQGRFSGTASGSLPGAWAATVNHTVLSPSGVVTGGDMSLATTLNGSPTLVTGAITGGSVIRQNPGSTGCVNQYYGVTLTLAPVRANGAGSGTGSFTGTLTHYRRSILGRCVTYWAAINGGLQLTL